MRQQNDTSEIDEHHNYVWRNINLQMIFQGVARSIVHIDQLSTDLSMPWLNGNEMINQNHENYEHQHDGIKCRMLQKRVNRWLPALPCQSKEFTGRELSIDHKI